MMIMIMMGSDEVVFLFKGGLFVLLLSDYAYQGVTKDIPRV